MKKVVSLSLDEELLKSIDVQRGDVPRSKWVEAAIHPHVTTPSESPYLDTVLAAGKRRAEGTDVWPPKAPAVSPALRPPIPKP